MSSSGGIMVYGAAKRGKSTAALAFAPQSLVIGVKSNISQIGQAHLGIPAVPTVPARDLQKVVELAEYFALGKSSTGNAKLDQAIAERESLIVDDISLRTNATIETIKASNPDDMFAAYGTSATLLTRLKLAVEQSSRPIVCTAHEIEPGAKSFKGKLQKWRGGPSLGSKPQVDLASGYFNFIGRVVASSNPLGWEGLSPEMMKRWAFLTEIWIVEPSADFVVGERMGVCWDRTPANLREIYRAGDPSLVLSRYEGLEFQDDLASQVREELDSKSIMEVLHGLSGAWADYIKTGKNAPAWAQMVGSAGMKMRFAHIRWAVRDGVARKVIEDHQDTDPFAFNLDGLVSSVDATKETQV